MSEFRVYSAFCRMSRMGLELGQISWNCVEITARPPAGTKKGFTTEKTEGTEKRKEESSGDSLSVTSVFSVVKYRTYAEGIC